MNDPEQKTDTADRIRGGLLGLALGDALGAPYEGGPLERLLWRVIGRSHGQRRWTDDTQMTLDLIDSLIRYQAINQDDLASRFAASYRWSRGYGPGTARILKRVRRGERWSSAARAVYKDGSYGNGGAMRAPAIGLFFAADGCDGIAQAARSAAEITHAHPLAQEGAVQIALATALALQGKPPMEIVAQLMERAASTAFSQRLRIIHGWFDADHDPTPAEVRAQLGNRMAAAESCGTALWIALRFQDGRFEDLIRFCIQVGGDVDTIAAMAGAIWGAAHGAASLPAGLLRELEATAELQDLAHRFSACVIACG
jgi:ADP-ribosylglycohydrolase